MCQDCVKFLTDVQAEAKANSSFTDSLIENIENQCDKLGPGISEMVRLTKLQEVCVKNYFFSKICVYINCFPHCSASSTSPSMAPLLLTCSCPWWVFQLSRFMTWNTICLIFFWSHFNLNGHYVLILNKELIKPFIKPNDWWVVIVGGAKVISTHLWLAHWIYSYLFDSLLS